MEQALSTGSGFALVGMAFLAVVREGVEAGFLLLALAQQAEGPAILLGALGGLGTALLFGIAIAWGGVRLGFGRFFRWTGVLILVVSAGLVSGALRALHEAGLWNGLQQLAFDSSGILPADGVTGSLLAGLFGYMDQPTLGEVLVYLAFLLATVPLFLCAPRQATAA